MGNLLLEVSQKNKSCRGEKINTITFVSFFFLFRLRDILMNWVSKVGHRSNVLIYAVKQWRKEV